MEMPKVDELTEEQKKSKEAMEFLRTRSLCICTPCYGGAMTCNYTNSLLSLINLCRDIGITHSVVFKYNESLIPRARNAMVHDFLTKHEETDFLFVDADISFEARDILFMMLQQDKEVIGVPCVRKSLNWSRIIEAIKKNGQTFSGNDLMKIGGEFVINFPADKQPTSFKIGELTEVQDVGTGIMRIKREVFAKIQKAFPDRYYWPMTGEENNSQPMYMFFQSGLDEESRKFNPGGLPHYVSEDYSFCRLSRAAGIPIWLMPWAKSQHFGGLLFEGDLSVVAASGGGLR